VRWRTASQAWRATGAAPRSDFVYFAVIRLFIQRAATDSTRRTLTINIGALFTGGLQRSAMACRSRRLGLHGGTRADRPSPSASVSSGSSFRHRDVPDRPTYRYGPDWLGRGARTGCTERGDASSSCACAAICCANSAVANTVEQALRPADQLGLRDPQLTARHRVVREQERDRSARRLGCEPASSSLIERSWISRSRFRPPRREGRTANLLEQLLDHAADPHDLRGLVDGLATVVLAIILDNVVTRGAGRNRGGRSVGPTTMTCAGRTAPAVGSVMRRSSL
jgi:hypothetical protein